MARGRTRKGNPRLEAIAEGWRMVTRHPLFAPLRRGLYEEHDEAMGLAAVTPSGLVLHHPRRRGDPLDWAWAFAHCLLHLGLGHADPRTASAGDIGPDVGSRHYTEREPHPAYRAACCVAADRFLRTTKIGRPPLGLPHVLPQESETDLAARWRIEGVPAEFQPDTPPDFLIGDEKTARDADFPRLLAAGIANAATQALDVAGGARSTIDGAVEQPWDKALGWFVSSYPLLGALAAGMKIVADADLARGWDISVAAVSAEAGEIYINPLIYLSEPEWQFVLAHEMLHAALRHGDRAGGRDPYLWNVAADYVINGWLLEMGVGEMPEGLLHDPSLQGMSAESVYDKIAVDLRRARKLATLRGRGLGDICDGPLRGPGDYIDLDEYYRRALTQGLQYHVSAGRGLIPAGLEQEIRALDQPPLAWDAQLARWFDEHVPRAERRRSYARASRRQSATPDIPRPGWVRPEEVVRRATFGVVLDTSGSMDVKLLGKALGAIASFATARDVPRARVVFCDAAAYDAGYLAVEEIASRVRVRGRGGTVLQPGIDLLERAEDFPSEGPILIITDGECDVVRVRREHAFLIPAGGSLPFRARGPVFRMR